MNKILIALIMALSSQLAFAVAVSNYCGAYASVIPGFGSYELFSNVIPSPTNAPCPGYGCPGIVRYQGTSLQYPTYKGIVASNSIIDDVFESDGVTLATKRMFTRNVIKRDGLGYVAMAFVSNGYPPVDGDVRPAWLTSSDGINWTYQGKLAGESSFTTNKYYGSGMALVVSDTGPRYTFWTDGFGRKLVRFTSEDGVYWKHTRDAAGAVMDLKPAPWVQGLFHSVEYIDGVYYMVASDKWPVTKWLFAHSYDGIAWIHDREEAVSSSKKNVSYYQDNGVLKGLATYKIDRNCYRKDIRTYPVM